MAVFSQEEEKYLLKLARIKIKSHLTGSELELLDEDLFISDEKLGCFVTLQKDNKLRGCIGMINPVMNLTDGVKDNAVSAAFRDTRFSPVTLDELPDIQIEISVLSKPVELDFKNSQDLLNQIEAGKHGVILENGYNRSTFLPQVWEQLPLKEDFLSHLCKKAGMMRDCWKSNDTIVKIYTVICFSE